MDDVAAREVPVYFEVEEEIISAPSKVMIYAPECVFSQRRTLGATMWVCDNECWCICRCEVSGAALWHSKFLTVRPVSQGLLSRGRGKPLYAGVLAWIRVLLIQRFTLGL